ncbi:MAG: hypothetical protein K0R28_2147 [Paenibacillus sp.]|jgi:hypothetical protein|nr:hypothetical protein [Paenibacillus sp.]
MADEQLPRGSDEQIANNRPPNLTEDFGVTDGEDKLDKEIMETLGLNESKKE